MAAMRARPLMTGALPLALAACLLLAGPVHAKPKDQERWDSKYDTGDYLFGKEPIRFLKEHVHLLPKGRALDIAMGEGRNGVFLATQGFQVLGLDISEKGLAKARKLAAERGVTIETKVVDLDTYRLEPNAYDVILCTYYLQRSLFPQIKEALKPGGMALVETYTMRHQKYNPKMKAEYLLQEDELPALFAGLKVVLYQTVDDGESAYASILVQKP